MKVKNMSLKEKLNHLINLLEDKIDKLNNKIANCSNSDIVQNLQNERDSYISRLEEVSEDLMNYGKLV